MTSDRVVPAKRITGDSVVNRKGEDLGKIEEVMLDLDRGRVAYAVLSFGGFLGLGDKLFAIPWEALQIDPSNRRVVLDVSKELLDNAPGFDKNNWPDMANRTWGESVYRHYGRHPYWM